MKLVKIIAIQGTLEVLTGLHIGAGDSEMHIGGTDSPVIKNPHTNLPYVPGSSIKGKMRSLLEWRYGLVGFNNGKPFGHKNLKPLAGKPEHIGALNLLKMFGVSGGDQPNAQEAEALGIGLTRLAFRDCELMDEWVRDKR
jgi:CRISPR-associated protein Csm3